MWTSLVCNKAERLPQERSEEWAQLVLVLPLTSFATWGQPESLSLDFLTLICETKDRTTEYNFCENERKNKRHEIFFYCKLCLIFRNLDRYLKYPFVSDLMLRRKKKKNPTDTHTGKWFNCLPSREHLIIWKGSSRCLAEMGCTLQRGRVSMFP